MKNPYLQTHVPYPAAGGRDTVVPRPQRIGLSLATLAALADGDLANAIVASTPGGIEQQEAQGQRAFVGAASRLPGCIIGATWAEITRFWGIQPGEVVDRVFRAVTLPEGWALKATDHSMWSDLVDANGVKRAGIFFKSAFYDYDACMHPHSRYHSIYSTIPPSGVGIEEEAHGYSIVDSLTGETIFKTPITTYGKASDQARAWLREHFPDQSPFAYWPDCKGKYPCLSEAIGQAVRIGER